MNGVLLTRLKVSGFTTGWLVLLPIVWVAVPLLAQVTLPPVDPALDVEVRPLEQLSSMALVLGIGHLCWVLGDSASWIPSMSPRSAQRDRLAWVLIVASFGIGCCLAAASLLPAGVTLQHVVFVWLMLFGCGVTTSVALGRAGAAVGPAVLVAVASLGGPGIWPWNVVYNFDARPPLAAVSAGMLAIGVTTYALFDERKARRGRHGLSTSASP